MSNLPIVVSQQFPEFIREDHPAFIAFVKAYYEWLDAQQPGTLTDLVDIDRTVDEYVEHFKAALDVNGTDYQYINLRRFLRNSKQFFTAKGSEEAYKFLFNILYGKPSEVITPWEYVLIPSEGQWIQDISVFVQTTKGSAADLPGEYIDITGTDGRVHRAFVKSVLQFNNDIWEVFLDKFKSSHIVVGSEFITVDRKIKGFLHATTARANVIDGSSGFEVGQLFNIDGFSGVGTIIKVKAVDVNGAITAVEIIAFGVGYKANFTTTIFPQDSIQREKVSNITLNLDVPDPGIDTVANYNTTDRLNNPSEGLLIAKHTYTNFEEPYFNDPTYVGTMVTEQRSSPAAATAAQTGAIIKMSIGPFAVYPGLYASGKSLVSDLSYIQDSNYYQKFSYVTVIEEVFAEYADLLKKTIHPAGTKAFGRYQITNELPFVLTVEPQLNVIERGEPFKDYAYPTDAVVKTFTKVKSDSATAADDVLYINVDKYILDEPMATDAGVIGVNPYVEPRYWVYGYFADTEVEI